MLSFILNVLATIAMHIRLDRWFPWLDDRITNACERHCTGSHRDHYIGEPAGVHGRLELDEEWIFYYNHSNGETDMAIVDYDDAEILTGNQSGRKAIAELKWIPSSRHGRIQVAKILSVL